MEQIYHQTVADGSMAYTGINIIVRSKNSYLYTDIWNWLWRTGLRTMNNYDIWEVFVIWEITYLQYGGRHISEYDN